MNKLAFVAGLLLVAAAGCSSDSGSGSDTPDPVALASSIKAQATSPGPAPAGSSAAGDCADAVLSAKAALSGTSYSAVDTVNGCDLLSVVVAPGTDPGVAKSMCANAAHEAVPLGVDSVVVITEDGTELASGDKATLDCTTER